MNRPDTCFSCGNCPDAGIIRGKTITFQKLA